MAEPRPALDGHLMGQFRNMVKDCQVKGACNRQFVRVEKLKEWLRDHLESLLESAYHSRSQSRTQPGLPIDARSVLEPEVCSLLVFSILLGLGQGNLIHRFYEHDLVDSKLPIDLNKLKTLYDNWNVPDADSCAEKFNKEQWRVCPAKLRYANSRDFFPSHIIPITKKQKINTKGGTATLWQIEVLEEFVAHDLRKEVSSSKFDNKKDEFGPRYQFALKIFDEGHFADYENEFIAFQALHGQNGIIRYLGKYTHSDHLTGGPTYNILLEFGEADLDEYFFDPNLLPPVLSTEIRGFWTELFKVANAVKDIHTFKVQSEEYYGWHADIKPDNILRVRGKFVLADPGFASFTKKEGDERLGKKREQTTMLRGGTKTYGAPECHPGRSHRVPVRRSIDIWSLGCVFSVAATWVVLGSQGILQFTRVRERAISKILTQRSHLGSKDSSIIHEAGDFFHDGDDVLKDVLYWHQHLRNSRRKTDILTNQVLDLVDENMLCRAENRFSAEELCKRLNQILALGQEEHRESLPQSLREALMEINETAQAQPAQPTVVQTHVSGLLGVDALQDRKERKSRLYDQPLVPITHRSEALGAEGIASNGYTRSPEAKSHTYDAKEPPQAEPSPSAVHATGGGIHASPTSPTRSMSRFRDDHLPSGLAILQTMGASDAAVLNQQSKSAASDCFQQNVWQARADIERRRKKDGGKVGRMIKEKVRGPQKDVLLEKHFGKRDIVSSAVQLSQSLGDKVTNTLQHFLIDNAVTMADHWDEAIFLLETLVMKAKGQDDNGIDLSFTNYQANFKSSNDQSKFKDAMESPQIRPTPTSQVHTDIRVALGEIMSGYLRLVEASRRSVTPVRALTVIVFTDGKWDGMSDKHDVENTIVNFVQELQRLEGNSLRQRQVSFEFVQFGNDKEARYRLQRLDDHLPFRGVPDIVDTEDSRGDVNKMLLGSFVEEYDKKNDDTIIFPAPSDASYPDRPPATRGSMILQDRPVSSSPPETDINSAHFQRIDTGQTRSSVTGGGRRPDPHNIHIREPSSGSAKHQP